MGTLAVATCDCGYSQSLMLGGGMSNFETVCYFPVYCRTCQILETVNVLESPVVCSRCGGKDVVAYDNPEMVGELGDQDVFSSNVVGEFRSLLCLSDGRYLCPACQRMQLRFQNSGCWD